MKKIIGIEKVEKEGIDKMINKDILYKIFIVLLILEQTIASDTDKIDQNEEKSFLDNAIDLTKDALDGTKEGELIDKIETLLKPNEIEEMKSELEKEYNARKLEQNKNPIKNELQNFQSIIINIMEEYLNNTKNIYNINAKSTKDIDLIDSLTTLQDIFNTESIKDNINNLNILINLYCIIEEEDFLYQSKQKKFFSEMISLNEDYYKIDSYMQHI